MTRQAARSAWRAAARTRTRPRRPPDEYHTDRNNSAYTNAFAATALQDATKAAQVVGATPPAIWTIVANGLKQTMPFDSSLNIYDEYDGYNGETVKQADVVMLTYPLDFPMASGVGLSDPSPAETAPSRTSPN